MPMRSKLFVSGCQPETFDAAFASAADAVSFDLEDAVPEARKDEARGLVAAYLRDLPPVTGKLVVVRVNAIGSPHADADLAAMVGPRVDIVNLPMVDDPAAIAAAAARLDRLEPAGRTRILVTVETPKALRRAAELAAAHPRVIGLQVGYGDLLQPCGIDRADPAVLTYVQLAVRFAAAEAGVAAYDGGYGKLHDLDGFRAECLGARRRGFAGKTCLHPSHIAIANEVFPAAG
jgi:citrate lyase subunit beta/citryl-CoA lyase